ncbi:MFS transporter [Novosphingobium aquiterrae]|uniref:MFS transporter n=1 Tax=Novosphingobium aquiterrae TaxID=624388 RepID=A0ABV6PHS4_9SPHN
MTAPTSPLAIPDYRRFWASRFLASFATTGMIVILGYQLYDVARSDYVMTMSQAAFQLGMFGLVQFVPMLLLTPISGLVADRNERRTVASLAIGVDLLIALVLAWATWSDAITLPLLYLLGVMHGSARVFFGPSLSSIPPNIVPAELLPRAIAMSSLSWQSASIAGPVLAGVLFARIPFAPYALAAALLALSIILLLAIRPIHPPADNRKTHPYHQVLEGFRFVRGERFLLGCITLDLFAVLLGGATALLPVFARDILHVGPEGLGQMRAATALGAVGTGLVLAVRPIAHNVGVKMLAGVGVYGAATLAFGLSRWLPLSLAMLALLGAGDMVSVFIRNSLVQLNTPDAVRGRVQAISSLAISASNELGEMQSGLAAALLGATGAVVLGGAGAVVITLCWAVLFPELIRARTFAPQYKQEPVP